MLKPSDKDIIAEEDSVPHIHNLDISWRNWLVWRFFDKEVLPFSGGFMEQPTWSIDDLMVIEAAYQELKEQINGSRT